MKGGGVVVKGARTSSMCQISVGRVHDGIHMFSRDVPHTNLGTTPQPFNAASFAPPSHRWFQENILTGGEQARPGGIWWSPSTQKQKNGVKRNEKP